VGGHIHVFLVIYLHASFPKNVAECSST